MADPTTAVMGEQEVTAVADALESAASQLEAQAGEEQVAEQLQLDVEPDAPESKMDAATLSATLKQREKELSDEKKRYAELQSMESRHYNEQREEVVKLRERLAATEALAQKQAEPDPDAIMERQRKFDQDWAERLAPGDPEKGMSTLQLFRGMMGEYLDETKNLIESRLGSLDGKVREINPVYQEHKEFVDALVGKGMSYDHALLAAQVVGANGKTAKPQVNQPGRVAAPGSVATEARAPSQSRVVQPLSVAFNSVNQEALRMMGLSQEEIGAIAREAGKDYANA